MRGLTCKLLVTCTCKDVNAYNANDVFICFQPWPAAQTRWREVAGHRTWSRGVTAPTARSVAAALVFSLSERTLQTTSPYLITSSSARVRQSCRRPSIRQRFVLDQGSTPRKIFSHISCCASVGPMVCPDGALLCDKKSRMGLRTRDFSIFLHNVS